MIAPLRRRHRLAWVVLAVLLPLALWLALAARQSQPTTAPLPDGLTIGGGGAAGPDGA